jgi:DNA topoisomerase VI subunit A
MFLKRLSKELNLPVFSLVDSDPYGHYIHSIYLRGSKRLSYESPFLATPNIKLLGVLTRDLDAYNIPNEVRLPMTKVDIKRTKDILNEDFVKQNKEWRDDLNLALKLKIKAEIQAFSTHGFEFLTEQYLPEKLSTGDWI